MTLDEAIKLAEEVAEENENKVQMWHKLLKNRLVGVHDLQAENNCIKCAEEHRQLAEWLKELKRLMEQTRWILDQEPLTDVEQRIFLAAMCKEEKVCKEICSDGEGVDLVAVCHSIERKVKKALWK